MNSQGKNKASRKSIFAEGMTRRGAGKETAAAWNGPGLGWDFLLELPIRFH